MIRGEYKGEGENSERGGGIGWTFSTKIWHHIYRVLSTTLLALSFIHFFYMFSYLIRMNCPMNS